MTYTRDQIIQALMIIQTTCKECDDCKSCPFRMAYDDCYINNSEGIFPNDWDIVDDKNWKAFCS